MHDLDHRDFGHRPADSKLAPQPYRWRWVVLGVILCAEIMDLLDATIVNLAATPIEQALGGGSSTVQWVVGAYTLAFAVALVVGGRLGDKFGRKNLFVHRRGRLHPRLAGLRGRPGPDIPDHGSRRPGVPRRPAHPQGFGIMKEVFPPRGSRQGVRLVRSGDRPVRGRRPAAGRRTRRCRPVRTRLAGRLPDRSADRHPGRGRRDSLHPAVDPAGRPASSTRSGRSARRRVADVDLPADPGTRTRLALVDLRPDGRRAGRLRPVRAGTSGAAPLR